MINLLLYIHRRKLERMIEKEESYDKIVRQSQILDKYINRKMKKMLCETNNVFENI